MDNLDKVNRKEEGKNSLQLYLSSFYSQCHNSKVKRLRETRWSWNHGF